jgi:hypothetical protein
VNTYIVVPALLAALTVSAAAQQPRPQAAPHPARSYKREVPRRLVAEARITEDSALAIALARVPGARPQALELESENGRLIWSWDLKIEGKSGIEEVNVNAQDGSIVGVAHEGSAAEPRESTRAAPRRRPARQPRTYAQQLVDRFVASHPDLAAVELALVTGEECKTVAATAPEDVGERCDADELGPIRTGEPDVEAPSASDPVYDITQALHDSAGRLIGAVGMDLKPEAGQDPAAVLERARAILRELESAIPSKARLLQPAGAP